MGINLRQVTIYSGNVKSEEAACAFFQAMFNQAIFTNSTIVIDNLTFAEIEYLKNSSNDFSLMWVFDLPKARQMLYKYYNDIYKHSYIQEDLIILPPLEESLALEIVDALG